MTAKRDLKRRVRQRQARTGESYVTARRRVLAARGERTRGEDVRDEAAGPRRQDAAEVRETTGETTERYALIEGDAPTAEPAMPVVELHDVTREAWQLGFRCRVTVYPSVLEACEVMTLLTALRDALVGAGGDPGRARLFDVAFGLQRKPPLELLAEPHVIAAMTFPVAGRGGAAAARPPSIDIWCRLWLPAPSLMLRRADELEPGRSEQMRSSILARFEREARMNVMSQLAEELFRAELRHAAQRALFVIHGGRRTQITKHMFVIGRDPELADLVISDGMIARKHAAVIFRLGVYYLSSLGPAGGILFKGMRIDNKRIDDGDVFHLFHQSLRFTFGPA